MNLPVDGIGLDFVEGKKTLELVKGGFPADKTLYAGIVNGKNIWRNNYEKSLAILEQVPAENVVLTTSCSLLHVPFTTANEEFEPAILNHFALQLKNWTNCVIWMLSAMVKVKKPLLLTKNSLRLSVLVKMLNFVLVLQG